MKYFCCLLSLLLIGCAENVKSKQDSELLSEILQSERASIKAVMEKLEKHELQLIFTEIHRENNRVKFTDHHFQTDDSNYFYPASSVKLPVAVLALEFIDSNPKINPQTEYKTDRDTLIHTIDDDLRQLFTVSDNEAYNRLYELLGRDYINEKLKEKGLRARIAHRLETENPATAKRNGLLFLVNGAELRLGDGEDNLIEKLDLAKVQKGTGYLKNDSLVNEPMDFSEKNYIPLETQHELMKRLFFPDNYSDTERFALSEESKVLLLKHMHTVPRKNGYQEWEVWDSFGKFFLFGDSKGRLPSSFKYYNKVGYAYGTLVDTAYIVDTQNDIEFFLSGTIVVNENQIFNDDLYEYGEVGIPFLAELGREIYQYELNKKR